MDKLNQLAKQYTKTKDSKICQDIFKLLNKMINDKANYTFYKRKFIKDKNLTFTMEVYDKEQRKFIKKEVPSCFRLCEIKKFDIEDIISEYNVFVLELLNKYDGKRPFKNYLFASIKNWKPYCIRDLNFRADLDILNENNLPKINGKKLTLDNILITQPEKLTEEIEEDKNVNVEELFKNLTKKEKKLLKIKKNNPKITQSQLADLLNVTQPRVCEILGNLRKKCKYPL